MPKPVKTRKNRTDEKDALCLDDAIKMVKAGKAPAPDDECGVNGGIGYDDAFRIMCRSAPTYGDIQKRKKRARARQENTGRAIETTLVKQQATPSKPAKKSTLSTWEDMSDSESGCEAGCEPTL